MPEQRSQASTAWLHMPIRAATFATAGALSAAHATDGLEAAFYTETLSHGQCYRRMGNNGAAIDMFRGFLQQPDATPEERQRAQQLIAMLQH